MIKCLITVLLLRALKFPEVRTCETTDELRCVITSRLTKNTACFHYLREPGQSGQDGEEKCLLSLPGMELRFLSLVQG